MSPNHRYIVSLVVVVVLAVLGFGSWHFLGRDDGPPVTVAQQAPVPAPAAVETAAPAPAAETAAVEAREPEPEPVELAFDVVRVEPTGDAVIAGRGAPGARVELLRNGETHDSLVVDATGAFAFVPPPLPAGASDVTLRATLPNGDVVASRQSVTVVVDESLTQQPMVAMVAPGEATVVLSRPEPAAEPPAAQPVEEVAQEVAQEAAEEAPAVAEDVAAEAEVASEVAATEVAPTEEAAPLEVAEAPVETIAETTAETIAEAPVSEAAETAAPEAATVEVAEAEIAEPAPAEAAVAEAAPEATPAAAPEAPVAVAEAAVEAPPLVSEPVVAEPARPEPPAAAPRVSIRIVSVEAETGGGLFVTGEGAPLAQVRLYLNDTFVARAQTDTAGAVSFAIGRGVMPGSYQVRLDDVADLTGQVLSRAEVGFQVPAFVAAAPAPAPEPAPVEAPAEAPVETPAAEAPAEVAQAAPQAEARVEAPAPVPATPAPAPEAPAPAPALAAPAPREPATVTIPEVATAQVTRGDSLWRISRQIYGRGVRYTEIFEANKDQIRDPNLIYPGQIFVLPADSGAAD